MDQQRPQQLVLFRSTQTEDFARRFDIVPEGFGSGKDDKVMIDKVYDVDEFALHVLTSPSALRLRCMQEDCRLTFLH